MSFRPIYEGWDIPGRLSRQVRKGFAGIGLNRDVAAAEALARSIASKLQSHELDTEDGQFDLADRIAVKTTDRLGSDDPDCPFVDHLADFMAELMAYEGWFALPASSTFSDLTRSELWQLEDHLKRTESIVDNLSVVETLSTDLLTTLVSPLVRQHPLLLADQYSDRDAIVFSAELEHLLQDVPELVEHWIGVPFAPEFEAPAAYASAARTPGIQFCVDCCQVGVPGDQSSVRTPKLPTRQSNLSGEAIIKTYLDGTPLLDLPDYQVDITLPQPTRFEHMHIVAGSGHGKTQTLQHLILHDLDTVARGEASIVVIDSQSDLINNIAGLDVFAPGGALDGRLVLIDPTDIEWPVALNLFDAGLDRLDQYSPLDRERLTNSILELYDFVLGSLLDAGMTQKQTVIFRYITRLLLHIPGATIHTLRELLEEGGYDRYQEHISKLQGSAKAFFENEFNGREFSSTKRQVLRRLYGILENQTFERMFSHPKSKLDLFSEMNAGKGILVNNGQGPAEGKRYGDIRPVSSSP